jgi:hypothetical protein
MILQESIRRILNEEVKLIPLIRRRVPQDELEISFREALDSASDMLLWLYDSDEKIMPLERYKNMAISMTMDGIHHTLHHTTPLDSVWYDDVYNSLMDYYKDRITERYNKVFY